MWIVCLLMAYRISQWCRTKREREREESNFTDLVSCEITFLRVNQTKMMNQSVKYSTDRRNKPNAHNNALTTQQLPYEYEIEEIQKKYYTITKWINIYENPYRNVLNETSRFVKVDLISVRVFSCVLRSHLIHLYILHLTTTWRPNNIRSESLSHRLFKTSSEKKKTNLTKQFFIVCAGDLMARHISQHTHTQTHSQASRRREETCSRQNKIVYKNRRINLFRPFHDRNGEFGTNATFVFIITHVWCVVYNVDWPAIFDSIQLSGLKTQCHRVWLSKTAPYALNYIP